MTLESGYLRNNTPDSRFWFQKVLFTLGDQPCSVLWEEYTEEPLVRETPALTWSQHRFTAASPAPSRDSRRDKQTPARRVNPRGQRQKTEAAGSPRVFPRLREVWGARRAFASLFPTADTGHAQRSWKLSPGAGSCNEFTRLGNESQREQNNQLAQEYFALVEKC